MSEAGRSNGSDGGRSWWAASVAVAATYFYFLIFAEFALLELASGVAATTETLRRLMLGLGVGGVTGALVAAWRFRAGNFWPLLAWSLRACAASAVGALAGREVWTLSLAAGAVGVSLGCATVVLAAGLRSAAGARLGVCVGVGTGAAYAACNVPWLFRASAEVQAGIAAGIVLAASFVCRMGTRGGKAQTGSAGMPAATRAADFTAVAAAGWVVILLALVWMDSAAFYIVQHTETLRAATWGGTGALWANAAVHLLAAIAAGVLLDLGWRGALAAAAVGALAVACLVLEGVLPAWLSAGWFYTAGVSLYSTVLVEYPARSGKPWLAALVFAVAGWIGSALGIGMAQDLARVPIAFVIVAVTAVAAALLVRNARLRRFGIVALAAAAAATTTRADDAAEVRHGREVYISEGCMHCHSQFLRPRVAVEVERWGPVVSLAEARRERPPLLGSRRQGPDLSQVGNRRSAEWNRLHLIAPRTIVPGSRMPSYAHLFRGPDVRGAALVSYLASLGAASAAERHAHVAAWRPVSDAAINSHAARRLFLRLCAGCHGETGQGDGVVTAQLSVRPVDWSRAAWRHVPEKGDVELALSRIIKFGLPGLPMAGHEYLAEAEIVGLARHAQTLHKQVGRGASAAIQP